MHDTCMSVMCAPHAYSTHREGGVWDKQHGVDVERAWLLEQTRALMAQGGATGLLWHHASHSEHARPMLQVSYSYILGSVGGALRGATDAAAVGPLLESLGCLVRCVSRWLLWCLFVVAVV